jgi:hypothetical protein
MSAAQVAAIVACCLFAAFGLLFIYAAGELDRGGE